MSRIDICYTVCRLAIQNLAQNPPGFQGINHCIKSLSSHPHKPIFYTSNSYDGSNVSRLTWSGNQVEYYTNHNFYNAIKMRIMLEFSTKVGQFKALFILLLVLMSAGNNRFNQL